MRTDADRATAARAHVARLVILEHALRERVRSAERAAPMDDGDARRRAREHERVRALEARKKSTQSPHLGRHSR